MRSLQPFTAFLCFTLALSAQGMAQDTKQPTVLIKNVRIFDGTSANLILGKDVLVEGNKIKRIGVGIEATGSDVIDAGGRVLIPGLINTHVHLAYVFPPAKLADYDLMYIGFMAAKEAKATLMRGFTTVRDVGGATTGLARAIDDGLIEGPRVFSSGAAITQTTGHGDYRTLNVVPRSMGGNLQEMETMRFAYIVDGRPQMLAAVREDLRQGATQIKVLNSGSVSGIHDPLDVAEFTLDEMKAAVEAASDFGTYVAVHSYNDKSVSRALEAGVMSIDHGNLMTEETMKLLKQKGAFLSAQVSPFVMTLGGYTEDMKKKNAEAVAGLDNMFKLAKKYDVTITHGTDIFGSPDLLSEAPKEFEYRTKWFTPFEILKQATSNGAALVELSGERNPYKGASLGVIREGAYADLVIVDGNPLEDITLLVHPDKNLTLIMKNGVIYKNTVN